MPTTSTTNTPPAIYLVSYSLPNGKRHLCVRSESMCDNTDIIALIDDETDMKKWLPMIVSNQGIEDLIPFDVLSQVLLLMPPTQENDLVFYDPEIDQIKQLEYLQTMARLYLPDCKIDSKKLPTFFKPTDANTITNAELEILADAILNGDQMIAEFILNQFTPTQLEQALTQSTTATDYSGRTVTGTLFQAALCAGDDKMCQMLKLHFCKAFKDQTEMQRQFTAVFPEGLDEHIKNQQQHTFDFSAIIAAINEKLNLTEAFNLFREQFTQLSHSEKIFNPYHLLKIYTIYNTSWDDKSDPDHQKRDLCFRQVIGFVQRFMPACYAQAFSQGLIYLVNTETSPEEWKYETLRRSFQIRSDGSTYYPISADSGLNLGFDCAIHFSSGSRRKTVDSLASYWKIAGDLIDKLCQTKKDSFQINLNAPSNRMVSPFK